MIKRFALVASILLSSAFLARAEDWPHWMGPRADGISKETGLLEKWPEDGPKKVWSAQVGAGYSSPLAVDGKVYLFTLEDKSREVLTAYDAATGKVLWSQGYDGGWTKSGAFPVARATPWIEEGKIYTYGGKGVLVCRELAGGKEIWSSDLMKLTGTPDFQQWGIASNPMIIGNLIYVQGGKGGPIAMAVDKTSGKLVWQSQAKGLAGYASIVQIDVQGTKQLIVFAGKEVIAMSPADGKTIWTYPWTTDWDVNAATPVYRDGYLLLTSGYKSGSLMLKVSPTSAQKVFENRGAAGDKHIQSRFQSAILEGDNLYANSQGIIRCMSWPDGKIKWEAKPIKPGMGGALLRVGDKMIILSDTGTLILAKVGPEGAEQISSVKLADGTENWATPLLYNGKLYVKTMKELICLDVSGK